MIRAEGSAVFLGAFLSNGGPFFNTEGAILKGNSGTDYWNKPRSVNQGPPPPLLLGLALHANMLTLKVQRTAVLMPSGIVRSLRYCPKAGAVLLIASLITPVIFNLPPPPRAYLKRGPP